jgi:hemerythrin
MKPFLSWRNDWLLGLHEIDEQHIALAAQLNRIHDVMVREGTRQKCDSKACHHLHHLVDMTRKHFRNEERVMRDLAFPGLAEHHREHVMLLAELQDLIRDIEDGEREFSLTTLKSLKLWQIDHVISSDREFMEYFRGQHGSEGDSGSGYQYQQSA